jgi:ABC-2 type transport system permease protein
MNGVIAGITLRQLLSRRRTILLVLLGLVLVLVALAGRASEGGTGLDVFTARLLSLFGIATLMPLVALLFGTGAIGSELDDGTAVYLLAKPVPRWTILLTKLAVAAGCSILLTGVPILLGGLVGVGGFADGLVPAFVVASAAGSVLYCAVFVALSLITGRALVIGLGYILIWEGILAGLFPGTRTFSIRQQTLSIVDALTDAKADVFNAQLELGTALVMALLVLVVAILLGVRRLSRLEIAGETA